MTHADTPYVEHRAEPRFDCVVSVLGASATSFTGTARDVSRSGLRLRTTVPIEVGRQLHLDFELSAGRVEAVGEVRRVTSVEDGSFELGIRFVRIAEDCVAAIREATGEHARHRRAP